MPIGALDLVLSRNGGRVKPVSGKGLPVRVMIRPEAELSSLSSEDNKLSSGASCSRPDKLAFSFTVDFALFLALGKGRSLRSMCESPVD